MQFTDIVSGKVNQKSKGKDRKLTILIKISTLVSRDCTTVLFIFEV